MLCETKNGKTVLIFEEMDCEPMGNYSLWDTILVESMCAQDPYFLLNREMKREEYGTTGK